MGNRFFLKKIYFFSQIAFFAVVILVLSSGISYPEEKVEVKRERIFEGEALYGFMNGGSELFLEYNFKKLKALDVIYEGEEYSIELYKMASAEDAFGIYSQHTYRCIVADTIYQADCFSRYQMQSVIGDTYISIVYPKPVNGVNERAVELMEYFSREIEKSRFCIPQEIDPQGKISGYLKMYRGGIALNNNAPELLDEVSGRDEYTIWSYDENNGRKVLIVTPDSTYLKLFD